MRAAPTDLESLSAQEVLAHVVDECHPRLYVACSFQKEASVVLDMLLAIEPAARVFTLDTGVLFPETYEIWRRIEERYGVEIDVDRGEWIDGLWRHPGKVKCAPLADWSEHDVWRYVVEHDVPYHPLHDRGYASIGCAHCAAPGGGRDGRWAGTDKIECGLHLPAS